MAKKLTISAQRLNDLCAFFDGLQPKEISEVESAEPMKAIRAISKICDELEAANEPYRELIRKLNDVAEPYRERYQAAVKEATDEERDNLLKEANEELEGVMKKAREEHNAEEIENAEVVVEIHADDRFDLAKRVFEKLSLTKYLKTAPLAETSEAFESATEL